MGGALIIIGGIGGHGGRKSEEPEAEQCSRALAGSLRHCDVTRGVGCVATGDKSRTGKLDRWVGFRLLLRSELCTLCSRAPVNYLTPHVVKRTIALTIHGTEYTVTRKADLIRLLLALATLDGVLFRRAAVGPKNVSDPGVPPRRGRSGGARQFPTHAIDSRRKRSEGIGTTYRLG